MGDEGIAGSRVAGVEREGQVAGRRPLEASVAGRGSLEVLDENGKVIALAAAGEVNDRHFE